MAELPTGRVCFYRPKRSKKRFFSVCDVARIAQNVVDDNGEAPEVVMAYVARQLGFTHISLSRVGTTEAKISLTKSVSLIKSLVVAMVRLSKTINFPQLTKILISIVEALDTLERAVDLIFSEPDQAKADDFIDEGKCKNLKPSIFNVE